MNLSFISSVLLFKYTEKKVTPDTSATYFKWVLQVNYFYQNMINQRDLIDNYNYLEF